MKEVARTSAPSAPPRRVMLVMNPKSGARAPDVHEAALRALDEAGIEVVFEGPCAPPVMTERIGRAAGEVDAIVVGGGDGTLNAVAPAVLSSGLPLGVLPLGTANDFARTLGVPDDLQVACAVLRGGRLHRVDVGLVNGVLFLNVASVGLGPAVAAALDDDVKRRLGALAYANRAVRAVRETRPFAARVSVDGEARVVRALHIAVGNGRHFGGGMTVAEDATIDDGKLDVWSVPPRSLWQLLRLAPSVRSGRVGEREGVRTWRGAAVEIETKRRMPVNTDGEVRTHTPARFSVLPSALTVYVPEDNDAEGLGALQSGAHPT